jgi:hypothetical protein
MRSAILRGEPGPSRVLRERVFWCSMAAQEVEVAFAERGGAGARREAVVRCTAFDPPTAVGCRRACLDPTYRRPWGRGPLGT